MALNLTSLQSALDALEKSFGYLNSDLAKDPDLREQFRAASIQAFEFTYELAFKMLKRQLADILSSASILERETFMFNIRTAAQTGLIHDVARFRRYRDTRNTTSHTYNPQKAEAVVAVLPDFIADIHYLLDRIAAQNAS
jgi:nucleotidyltransferase substrate binding protein (TIGR01987 family)